MTPQEKQFVLDCARDMMVCFHNNHDQTIKYFETEINENPSGISSHDKWCDAIPEHCFKWAHAMLDKARKRGLFEPNS